MQHATMSKVTTRIVRDTRLMNIAFVQAFILSSCALWLGMVGPTEYTQALNLAAAMAATGRR